MKFKEAKKYKGDSLSLLEMDNIFSPHNNVSLFGCGDGREAVEKLMESGKSNFSYVEDMLSEDPGYCVEFELTGEKPESSELSDCENTTVIITDVWEH